MIGRAAHRLLLVIATVVGSASCGAGPSAGPAVSPPNWGAVAVDEVVADLAPAGRTQTLRVPVRAPDGATAILVAPIGASDDGYCFQLEAVVDGHGTALVAAADNRLEWGRTCYACSQRVGVGHGFGWFILPNDGIEHDFGDHFDLVVSARDCATLLPIDTSFEQGAPGAVRVRAFAFATKRRPVALDLFAAYTDDSGLAGPGVRNWLARVVELAGAYFPPDAPTLVLRGSASLGMAPGAVRFGDGEQAALDKIHRAAWAAAGQSGVDTTSMGLVLFATCLKHIGPDGAATETQGYSPRIPGGGGDGTFADGVFVSASGCGAGALTATPERAAKILAHELGHFLGLYHTVEASGAQDLLPDTDSTNLMSYLPDAMGNSGLSPMQVLVMRQHPYVHGRALSPD